MKLLMASIIVSGLITFQPQEGCRCVPATKDETTRWGGNQSIVIKEEKVYKRLFGTVTYALVDEPPISDALVEVYTQPDNLLSSATESEKKKKQRRIAACVTGEDGKFCFGFIKAGKYEMRVSLGSGVNVTHIYVEVDPYALEGTDEEISATLSPGT